MSARKNAFARAKKYGAVIIDEYMRGIDSQVIEIEAPDGYEWSASNSVIIISHWFTYEKGSKDEAWKDLFERMEFGLDTLSEEK